MSRIRTLSVAALVMALAVAASSARAADEAKKSDSAAIHGVVTAVDKDAKTFTIKVEMKKAKSADATATEEAKTMTFKVDDKTVFTKVAHKKKGETAEPEGQAAKFEDVKDGEHVAVEATNGVATSVKIHAGKKKPAA